MLKFPPRVVLQFISITWVESIKKLRVIVKPLWGYGIPNPHFLQPSSLNAEKELKLVTHYISLVFCIHFSVRRSATGASAEFSTRRWLLITRFFCSLGGRPTIMISKWQRTRLDALGSSMWARNLWRSTTMQITLMCNKTALKASFKVITTIPARGVQAPRFGRGSQKRCMYAPSSR